MLIIAARAHKGFTLIEMLLGLAVGLFLAGITLYIYSALSKSYYDMLSMNRLEGELRSSMNKMVQDIRRAGYSASAISSVHTGVNSNAFMATGSDISIPNSSCILFTYDSDASGLLPALNATDYDKRFGFRLFNNTLQSRPLTDSSFSCTGGAWQALTDNNIVDISNLSFTANNTSVAISGSSTLVIRNISISITGSLKSDPAISRTLSETIRVRNDKYQP